MPLTASIALALSAALGPSTPPIPAVPTTPPAAQTVQEYVADYFKDIPIMVDIASCESHMRQYDVSGTVYRGEQNHQDVGVMQINEHYHLELSKKLGYDIYTMQGNAAYARYLYEQEGTAPWISSSPCWSKRIHSQPLATAAK